MKLARRAVMRCDVMQKATPVSTGSSGSSSSSSSRRVAEALPVPRRSSACTTGMPGVRLASGVPRPALQGIHRQAGSTSTEGLPASFRVGSPLGWPATSRDPPYSTYLMYLRIYVHGRSAAESTLNLRLESTSTSHPTVHEDHRQGTEGLFTAAARLPWTISIMTTRVALSRRTPVSSLASRRLPSALRPLLGLAGRPAADRRPRASQRRVTRSPPPSVLVSEERRTRAWALQGPGISHR